MAGAYLVGHGGGLSPNAPGGDPVGNALRTRDALQRTELAKQAMEQRDRALKIQQDTETLKNLMSEREVWGANTPQRQQINSKLLGMLGITETGHIAPEAVDNMISVTAKRLSAAQQKLTSGKLSQDAFDDELGTSLMAVHDAINNSNLTVKEKEALRGAAEDIGKSGLRGSEEQQKQGGRMALEGFRQQGDSALETQRQGGRLELERVRSENRTKLAGLRGPRTGGNPAQQAAKEFALELLRGERATNKDAGTKTTTSKIGDTEITTTKSVPAPLSDEQIDKAITRAKEIVDKLFPAGEDGQGAAFDGIDNSIAVRVENGQSPEAAALGAVDDVAGPTIAYGMPDAYETTPDEAVDAVRGRLALWEEANPDASIEEQGAFIEQLLAEAGYLQNGVVAPKFEEVLKRLFIERGLVEE